MVDEIVEQTGVDFLHLADIADIDLFRIIAIVDGRELLLRADEARILARDADGLDAAVIEQVDDLRIHLAVEHHLRDLDGLLVRDAQAGDKGCLLADLLEEAGDLRTAAVDDDGAHTDVLEQRDILHDLFLQGIAHHGIAAVFDDDGLAVEFLDIRQRLDEDGCLVLC